MYWRGTKCTYLCPNVLTWDVCGDERNNSATEQLARPWEMMWSIPLVNRTPVVSTSWTLWNLAAVDRVLSGLLSWTRRSGLPLPANCKRWRDEPVWVVRFTLAPFLPRDADISPAVFSLVGDAHSRIQMSPEGRLMTKWECGTPCAMTWIITSIQFTVQARAAWQQEEGGKTIDRTSNAFSRHSEIDRGVAVRIGSDKDGEIAQVLKLSS